MTQTLRAAPEAPASTGRSRWPGCLAVAPSVLPALVMLVVGRFRLRQPTLGWDENATWIASQRTGGQIVDLARHFDGVISPYYMFMHFWTAVFGDSEFAMRAPSLIAVAAGVGISAELAGGCSGPGVGLLGGLLLVTGAAAVPVRPGRPRVRAGLPSCYARDAAALPGARAVLAGRWIAYGVLVTLVGFAHILALLVLIGHAFVVLTRWWTGRDRAAALDRGDGCGAGARTAAGLSGLTQRGAQLDWMPPMNQEQMLGGARRRSSGRRRPGCW